MPTSHQALRCFKVMRLEPKLLSGHSENCMAEVGVWNPGMVVVVVAVSKCVLAFNHFNILQNTSI